MSQENCIFCKIIEQKILANIIKETDDILVLEDIAPKAHIHYLIIPRKHIKDIQSLEPEDQGLAAQLLFMAKELSKEIPHAKDFKLVVNSGADSGQKVFHLHFHFLAGKQLGEI